MHKLLHTRFKTIPDRERPFADCGGRRFFVSFFYPSLGLLVVIVLSFGTFGRYFEYFDGMFGKGGEATIVNIVVGSEVRIYCGAGC